MRLQGSFFWTWLYSIFDSLGIPCSSICSTCLNHLSLPFLTLFITFSLVLHYFFMSSYMNLHTYASRILFVNCCLFLFSLRQFRGLLPCFGLSYNIIMRADVQCIHKWLADHWFVLCPKNDVLYWSMDIVYFQFTF